MTIIACIANNGSDGSPEVPLWLCPCAVCTKLDWEALGDDRPLLREHRHDGFPEAWDAQGRAITTTPLWSAFAPALSPGEVEAERAAFDAAKTDYIRAHVVVGDDGLAKLVRD